jgi:hypothetical protein
MNHGGIHRIGVEFESEGAALRGFLYEAVKGEPPFPIVIMAHGTSATIPMVADRYAEVFARAGVSSLIYDHRNFGISGGEPRQEINPWVQCRGFRDAITFEVWYDLDGGHFGLIYYPGELFDEASRVQAEYLTRYLLSARP